MKIKHGCFFTDKDWIVLIPTISIVINNPIFYHKNFALCFHFFIWHWKVMVIRGEKE